tara:strand:- start:596 stop:709 length:114 start_codon:yes stop_codon:yes gene_type:complete
MIGLYVVKSATKKNTAQIPVGIMTKTPTEANNKGENW